MLRFGRCELRLDTRELLLQGKPQPVRKRIFEVILYLVSQRPRTVSHGELLNAVWKRNSASPSVIARAVMEARRARGDTASEPELFASVHGVGYRFIGAAAAGVLPPTADADATPAGADDVRELLERSRAALQGGRLDEAQTLAERALAQADAARSHTARVRALALCSSLALRRGTAAAAASLAAEALRVARAEGDAVLVAQARSAVGFVHLVAGDRALALRHFQESRSVLSAPGCEQDLLLCLNRMAMAFRDVGNPESALQITRRALALAQQIGTPQQVAIERNNEVMFLLLSVHQKDRSAQLPESRARCSEALALVDHLLADLPPSAPQRQSALGNRAGLLEKLGRLDEAWATLCEFEKTLDLARLAGSPVYAERLGIFKLQRAGLLAATGRMAEAMTDVRAGLEAAEASGQNAMLPRLYEDASAVAERAGLLQLALLWARRQAAAQQALHASQAATLTSILRSEMHGDAMQASLDGAQAQLARLLRENAELRDRVANLSAAMPLSPFTSLAPAEHLSLLYGAAHQHARERGLPMCFGVIELVNGVDLARFVPHTTIESLFKRVAEILRGQAEVVQPPVALHAGCAVFFVREAGLRRAQQLCDHIAQLLAAEDWTLITPTATPTWRCDPSDAADVDILGDWRRGLRASASALA